RGLRRPVGELSRAPRQVTSMSDDRHDRDAHASTPERAHNRGGGHHPAPLSPVEVRARALEELLTAAGVVDPTFIDGVVTAYERDIGPMNGARVVARAWVDLAYRGRLLTDATKAIAELGFGGPEGEHMVVVE